jgi:arylsulfatase A-like enzyme
VGLEDIMPTFLDMTGVDIPDGVEGRSLLPLASGETTDWCSYMHIEHAPIYHSMKDGKEKYIWFAGDGREQFTSFKIGFSFIGSRVVYIFVGQGSAHTL